jgi:hypothetical protein
LNPQAVRKGFYRAKLLNEENNLESLKEEINKYIKSFPESCPLEIKVNISVFIIFILEF